VKRLIPLALKLGLAALAVTAAGCKLPPKPMRFNNLMAKGNEKLAAAGQNFKKAIEPLSKGGTADDAAVRSAVNEADKTVTDLIKDFDNMAAPKHGDSLLAKYKEFLKTQRQIVDECMKPALKVIEDNKNYPTAMDKWPQVRKLTDKANSLEQEAFRALVAAQSEFCDRKEYMFEPKD
jgi:hypothetical protein